MPPARSGPSGRAVVAEVDDWESLRQRAAGIKDDTLAHLDEHLLTLEAALTARGATVHWARDAADACAVVADVAKGHGIREVVKVKSMATQEIELNEALAAQGISAWETDLAELIVQLGDDLPSHILVPAIHRNRSEIRDIFRDRMAAAGRPAPEGLTDDPAALASARPGCTCARSSCRRRMAVSGANFAVARVGHAGRGGVRGQRPDVPDPARGARDGGGHREAGAHLGRPRRVPAAAAALLDRRADEPLHLHLVRGHPRRRAAGGARGAARQRPHPGPGRRGRAGRRCAASAARPA